jgi:hypothetical protein
MYLFASKITRLKTGDNPYFVHYTIHKDLGGTKSVKNKKIENLGMYNNFFNIGIGFY